MTSHARLLAKHHRTVRSLAVVIILVVGACGTSSHAQQHQWPTHGWPTSTPEAQGLDPTPLTGLTAGVAGGQYGYVDRMVVVRNGHLVVNARWENDYREISRGTTGALGCGHESCDATRTSHEYNYYHPSTHPYYQDRDVHSLQSVTKSVTASLFGVALLRGQLESLDTPLLSFFGSYDLTRVDDRLHRATLEDLLTMRSGIEWHEQDRPLDETNTTLLLERSDDWIQFTLDQPTDADPGAKWVYNSGGSHLMSGIIREATGQFVDEYAERHLFGPLGIADYHWKKTPRGYPDTEGGLYLEAEQLAKVGYLYLRDGMWDGRRILAEGFVAAATARQVDNVNPAGWGYGYQWWRLDTGGTEVWAGLGFGGQFLLVLPQHEIVGVVNSWNLFGSSQANVLTAFRDALLSAAGATDGGR